MRTLFLATAVNENKSGTVPFSGSATVTLLDVSRQCGNATAKSGTTYNGEVSVAVTGGVSGSMSYNVAATGTLVPPSFSAFTLSAGLDSTLSGKLTLAASASVRGVCHLHPPFA